MYDFDLVQVNGKWKKISVRAMLVLTSKMASKDEDVCRTGNYKHTFACTRANCHRGPHIAHGVKYSVIAVWLDSHKWLPKEMEESS